MRASANPQQPEARPPYPVDRSLCLPALWLPRLVCETWLHRRTCQPAYMRVETSQLRRPYVGDLGSPWSQPEVRRNTSGSPFASSSASNVNRTRRAAGSLVSSRRLLKRAIFSRLMYWSSTRASSGERQAGALPCSLSPNVAKGGAMIRTMWHVGFPTC
jgi:hypothetical protein